MSEQLEEIRLGMAGVVMEVQVEVWVDGAGERREGTVAESVKAISCVAVPPAGVGDISTLSQAISLLVRQTRECRARRPVGRSPSDQLFEQLLFRAGEDVFRDFQQSIEQVRERHKIRSLLDLPSRSRFAVAHPSQAS